MDGRSRGTVLDNRFGFPVRLEGVPLKTVWDEVVPAVNGNDLRWVVLGKIASKATPLTGNEVRFVRLWMEKTLSGFGEMCGVSHAAVKKWEDKAEGETAMARGTEFLLRTSILERLPDAIVWGRVLPNPEELRGNLSRLQAVLLPRKVEPETILVTGRELDEVALLIQKPAA